MESFDLDLSWGQMPFGGDFDLDDDFDLFGDLPQEKRPTIPLSGKVVKTYRPGVLMLCLQGKWAVGLAFEFVPTEITLEYWKEGKYWPVDLAALAKKKKKDNKFRDEPLIRLGNLERLKSGKVRLEIKCKASGNIAPFPCTSKSNLEIGPVFRFTAKSEDQSQEEFSEPFLICNHDISDVSKWTADFRSRVEAALEDLVYVATIAWKTLKTMEETGQVVEWNTEFQGGRRNKRLEADILTLFLHRDLRPFGDAAFSHKFGEDEPDELRRKKKFCDEVVASGRGDGMDKVVRGVCFVLDGKIRFGLTADNSDARTELFKLVGAHIPGRPCNPHNPECVVPLTKVIKLVDEKKFRLEPLLPQFRVPEIKSGPTPPTSGGNFLDEPQHAADDGQGETRKRELEESNNLLRSLSKSYSSSKRAHSDVDL